MLGIHNVLDVTKCWSFSLLQSPSVYLPTFPSSIDCFPCLFRWCNDTDCEIQFWCFAKLSFNFPGCGFEVVSFIIKTLDIHLSSVLSHILNFQFLAEVKTKLWHFISLTSNLTHHLLFTLSIIYLYIWENVQELSNGREAEKWWENVTYSRQWEIFLKWVNEWTGKWSERAQR